MQLCGTALDVGGRSMYVVTPSDIPAHWHSPLLTSVEDTVSHKPVASLPFRRPIILIHDIWGIYQKHPTAQRFLSWADTLASKGFPCIAPDFFGGNEFPFPTLDPSNWGALSEWLPTHPLDDMLPILDLACEHSTTEWTKAKPIVVGFCWGAACAQHIGLSRKESIGGIVCIHGCFLKMHEIGPQLAKTLPTCYLCGGDDAATPEEKISIVSRAFDASPLSHELRVYPDETHWFALPRELNDKSRETVTKVLEDTVAFVSGIE